MPHQSRPRNRALARAAGTIAALALLLAAGPAAAAPAPVPLGTADSFALLAGSTITNTGTTTISGDIGLCCTGLATTGFGPGADQVNQSDGALYVGPGSPAATAQDDLDIAYGDAAARPVTRTLPVDLSLSGTPANPLLPGVYESTAHGALQINTGLTLDFQGDPDAVFIFQGTTLTTAAGAGGSVQIVNGGSAPSACNIFWQLSDATQGVTLGAGSAFLGTTMSLGASVLGTGATVEGRILTRRSKAVSLDSNTIRRSSCAAAVETGGDGEPAPTTTSTTDSTPPPGAAPPPAETGSADGGSADAGPAAPAGSAWLSGPSRLVRGPFTVAVTGREIRSVTFWVNGKRRGTVRAWPGRRRFALRIDPRRQSRARRHRVTARVRFSEASGSPTTSRTLTYRRAPRTVSAPRFTG